MGMDAQTCEQADVERTIENDPALMPVARSALLVEPAVLDPLEVEALLVDLAPLLAAAATTCDEILYGADHEPHAPPVGCDRGHSKLSPLAWLFSDHAGIGRPARHKQGHHLRARRGFGKKARPAPRQAQGSLFG